MSLLAAERTGAWVQNPTPLSDTLADVPSCLPRRISLYHFLFLASSGQDRASWDRWMDGWWIDE